MRVCEVMTPLVLTVPPHTTIQEGARKMRAHRIGLLPVSENGRIVGVLTDRDIAIRAVAEARHAKLTTVRDIMTNNPITCLDTHDVEDACLLMESNHVRRLLVTDRDGRLRGIVSVDDLAARGHRDRLSGEVLRIIARAS